MSNRVSVRFLQLLPTIVLLGLWQFSIARSPTLDFTIGSPFGILREFRVLAMTGGLVHDFGATLLETILGFLAGTIIGTAAGLVLWRAKTAYNLLQPYILALGALPIIALGPVMIFWFGTGILSKVILGFVATVVIAFGQAYSGACEADAELLGMVQAFGGTRRQAFWRIVVPSSALWVMAGIRINVSMALLAAFVGEFIASRIGLGHLIIVAEGLYNVNQIWVGVIGILLIAFLFHLATVPLEGWANKLKTTND